MQKKKKNPNSRRTKILDDTMDDANIDIEDEQQTEQERIAAAAAAAARRRRLELISVLEGYDKIPFRSRNKTDELVDHFLVELGDDVHDMLCDNNIEQGDYYHGLDSDRDTEEEVEAIVRVFPGVLSKEIFDENGDFCYPIHLLAFTYDDTWRCKVKAVSFIPIVARLAIEIGCFEEEKKGGLLCLDTEGDNVLHGLMLSDSKDELYKVIDDKYLQVLIQLRKMGYLKKEDIHRYDLLHKLCIEDHFAEKRFRLLVEWDPSALTQTDAQGYLPIHCAAEDSSIIRGFQLAFEYGIRYFPEKKGISLIFKKNHAGITPFQYACKKFGYEEVIKVVEETLIRCYSSSSSDDTPLLNIVEALLSAAIEENIHLDCVYFLLRREPDVLQKLLSLTTPAAVAAMDSNNNIGIENNNGFNDGFNDDNLSQTKTNPKKRKRKEIMNDDDNN
jgi:hypothetical protein